MNWLYFLIAEHQGLCTYVCFISECVFCVLLVNWQEKREKIKKEEERAKNTA